VELAKFSPFAKELRQITQQLSKSQTLKFE